MADMLDDIPMTDRDTTTLGAERPHLSEWRERGW